MIPGLDTPELVHAAMLRGTISRISMSQCAHTWGPKAVDEHNHAAELRGDLKTTMDVLWEYDGDFAWTRAQMAVGEVKWLKDELKLAHVNEMAARETALAHVGETQAARREVERLRRQLTNYALDNHGPQILTEPTTEGLKHVEEARKADGPEGQV